MKDYFDEKEFTAVGCKKSDMSVKLLEMLNRVREFVGFPLVLTSAFRSPASEKSCGRSGSSAHTKGMAVDIYCIDGVSRLAIVQAAFAIGFRRIGIGPDFIHLDIDSTKSKAMWTYYKPSNF